MDRRVLKEKRINTAAARLVNKEIDELKDNDSEVEIGNDLDLLI